MVHLADYPHIRLLFWSAPGLQDADETTVYSALDNGWKWIDWQALTQEEKDLIDRLAVERGGGWIGDRHVSA
jgi:hypothetical protein